MRYQHWKQENISEKELELFSALVGTLLYEVSTLETRTDLSEIVTGPLLVATVVSWDSRNESSGTNIRNKKRSLVKLFKAPSRCSFHNCAAL
jgi:hypothetical protein